MIRRMQAGDLHSALKLTQAENWPHRLEDWEFHYRLGRGWVVCDADGTLLGTALWWPYADAFATVGLVVVDRKQQGKGIGRQLMDAVMDDASPRALQLVATKAGLKLYQQCGFRERGSIEQRQGVPTPLTTIQAPSGTLLRAVTLDDLPSICDLDEKAFGASRHEVIKDVVADGSGVVAVRGGRLTGFALIRRSGRGALIGPIVAGDETLAIALVSHLLKTSTGFTRVDVPADARQLAAWLDSAGLVCVDQVMTMVRGNRPEPRSGARIFGLVSQALN